MITINCFDNISDEKISLVEMIALFVMTDLKLTHDVTININTLEEMDDSVGLCYSNNEIDICYEENFYDLFKVVAHELRHVWQKVHNSFSFKSSEYSDYDLLPWEIDAHRYEEIMVTKIKSNKRNF